MVCQVGYIHPERAQVFRGHPLQHQCCWFHRPRLTNLNHNADQARLMLSLEPPKRRVELGYGWDRSTVVLAVFFFSCKWWLNDCCRFVQSTGCGGCHELLLRFWWGQVPKRSQCTEPKYSYVSMFAVVFCWILYILFIVCEILSCVCRLREVVYRFPLVFNVQSLLIQNATKLIVGWPSSQCHRH